MAPSSSPCPVHVFSIQREVPIAMPCLLKRGSQELSVTDWDWNFLVRMAKAYGWAPIGSSDPRDIKSVTKADAHALVAALEKALPEIPEECTIVEDQGISSLPDDPLDWFSGDGRTIVR